jgi:gamma-glutamyltranspeptidase/glutathione hydrolase
MMLTNFRLTRRALGAMLLLVALAPAVALSQDQGPTAPSTAAPPLHIAPVTAQHGMVVTQDKHASRIGLDVLERGGNAVDAAVAVGFALAVTLPKAGNLGGGGFMLVHLAGHDAGKDRDKDRDKAGDFAVDYREVAPHDTTPDVFLDQNGEADRRKSRDSGLAVGVPGTVAGLALALERYGSGRFTLADLIAPALALARDGVPVEDDLLDSLRLAHMRLGRFPTSARIFLKDDGASLGAGDRLVQSDLAATLEAVARDGARAFYHGPIADEIVAAVREAGGRMTRADLERYEPVVREPVRGTYRDYEIVSMPPPSSGGVHLIEMLNVLEGFSPREMAAPSVANLHLMVETMKLAFADRAEYLGDSDAVAVPVTRLISKPYADALRDTIDRQKARPAVEIRAGAPPRASGDNTTHFSIVDQFGNAVANTYSLNFNYGLGLVAGSTGVVLNNTLDDFAAKPGVPNAFGLTGGAANAPGPSRRPLSSMTPTIVLRNGAPAFVTGAPGGSRIITTVLQVLVNAIDFEMPIAEAVAAPRVHDQWLPDEVVVEGTLSPDIRRALAARGHTVVVGPVAFGSAHSIAVTPAGIVGAADSRAKGALAAGY